MEALVGSLLLIPLLGALLMPWVSKLGRRAADAFVTLAMLATLVSCLGLLPAAKVTTVWQAMGTHFAVDGLSLLFLVVIERRGIVLRRLLHRLHRALRRPRQVLLAAAAPGDGAERRRAGARPLLALPVPGGRLGRRLRAGRLQPGVRRHRVRPQVPAALGGGDGNGADRHRAAPHDHRHPRLRGAEGRPGRAARARTRCSCWPRACSWPGSGSRRRWCRSTPGCPTPTPRPRRRSPPCCPASSSRWPASTPCPAVLRPLPGAPPGPAGAAAARRRLDGRRRRARLLPDRHQAAAGLLVDLPDRLHPDRPGDRQLVRRRGRPLPRPQPRHLQVPPLPEQRAPCSSAPAPATSGRWAGWRTGCG